MWALFSSVRDPLSARCSIFLDTVENELSILNGIQCKPLCLQSRIPRQTEYLGTTNSLGEVPLHGHSSCTKCLCRDLSFRMPLVLTVCTVHVCDRLSCVIVSASFYGASYISVPLQDAKSTTDLQFKFRTRRPDAMLFLAAGRTDYCLVRLESGRLKVRIEWLCSYLLRS